MEIYNYNLHRFPSLAPTPYRGIYLWSSLASRALQITPSLYGAVYCMGRSALYYWWLHVSLSQNTLWKPRQFFRRSLAIFVTSIALALFIHFHRSISLIVCLQVMNIDSIVNVSWHAIVVLTACCFNISMTLWHTLDIYLSSTVETWLQPHLHWGWIYWMSTKSKAS